MKSASTHRKALRVGIVGCGNVAEHHVRFVKLLDDVQLVGVADVDERAAQLFAEKYSIPTVRGSVASLLDSTELDVLHVTTPPAYHYDCSRIALDRGVHVFVEKPVAFSVQEVNDLYERASAQGVLLCPDYIQLFHPKMQKLLGLIESGKLGRVVHVESHWSLNLDDELRDAEGLHWTYRLPGGLLRDYASHVLYQTLYFAGSPKDIQVIRKSTGNLPQGLSDHLLIQVDGTHCTASILLTCQARPSSYGIRVYGEKGSAEIDFDMQTLVLNRSSFLPRRITSVTGSFTQSWSRSTQTVGNVWGYLRGSLVPYSGLQVLIPRFYDSILNGKTPPVSRELAIAVTQTEEKIFTSWIQPIASGCYLPSSQSGIRRSERVLVTGASGYVGRAVVEALVDKGYYVRALARPTSKLQHLQELGVEIFLGDVRRLPDVNAAAAGMDVIVHAAAGMKGSAESIVDTCVRGTDNVVLAASEQAVNRVLYISSFSVYNYTQLKDGQCIDENSPLEDEPETRGAYTIGKTHADKIARSHLIDKRPAWTILRPSLVVGNGRDILGPLGPRIGSLAICLGTPSKKLLLIHVKDLAAATVQLLEMENTKGKIFVVSDPDVTTVRQYIRSSVRRGPHENVHVFYVPYFVARLGAIAATVVKKVTQRGPGINRRRLLSMYRSVSASSALLLQETGWQPAAGLLERLATEAEGRVSSKEETVEQVSVAQV